MSSTIDDRIVSLEFDNKQFEQGVSESLNTLEKLKNSLELDDAGKSLSKISDEAKKIDLSHVSDSVDQLNERFSTLRLVGLMALSNLVDGAMNLAKKFASVLTAPIRQAASGGWNRALNIEEAKFQLEGLGVAWKDISEDINYGVQDTAYGLDAAAKAASQLVASGVKVGDSMKHSLLAISGVAAMTSSSYEEISPIFTTVAGQGKLMTMQLRQLESRGLNAAAVLGQQLGKSEAEIRDMVTKGKISFNEFSDAMYEAFGEHAKDANNTFMGSLSNVKAALNKIGAEFATPLMNNVVPVFNSLRLMINGIKANMGETFKIFEVLTRGIGTKLSGSIDRITDFLNNRFTGVKNLNNALYIMTDSLIRIGKVIGTAFKIVFNGSMGDHINNLARGIEKIAKLMQPTHESLNGLQSVLVVIFSIIKKIGQLVGFIIKNIGGPIFTIITKTVHLLFTLISVISRLSVGLTRAISESKAFQLIIKGMGDVAERVKNFFGNLKTSILGTSDSFSEAGSKIKDVLSTIKNIVAALLALPIIGIYTAFNKLRSLDFTKLSNALTNIKKIIVDLFNRIKDSKVVTFAINALSTAGLALMAVLVNLGKHIKDFFNKLADGEITLDSIKNKILEIPDALANVWSFIKDKLNFDNFGNGLKKLYSGLVWVVDKIGSLFSRNGELNRASGMFEKFGGGISSVVNRLKKSLSGLTSSRVILVAFSTGLALLAINSNKLVNALTGLVKVASSGLTAVVDKLTGKKSKLEKFTQVLITISIVVLSLAGAFKVLSTIESTKLTQIAIAIGSIVGGFLALSTVISALDKEGNIQKGVRSISLSMALLSVAMLSIAAALKIVENVPANRDMWIRIAMLSAILAEFAGMGVLLSKLGPNDYKEAAGMIGFALTILAIAAVLKRLDGIDLSGIKGAWKELTAIILAMAVASRIIAGIGVGALVGILAYLVASKLIMKRITEFSDSGQEATSSLDKFKTGIQNVISKFREILDMVKSEFSKWSDGELSLLMAAARGAIVLVVSTIGSIIMALVVLARNAKGIKKLATSFLIIAAALAGLMMVAKYISDWIGTDSTKLSNFKAVATIVGALILVVGAFMALSNNVDPDALKGVKKIIGSISFLFISLSALIGIIGLLSPDQMDGATDLILKTLGVLAGIVLVSEIIGKIGASNSTKFGHFAGLVLMMASLMSAMAVLMVVLNDKDDYIRLATAVGAILVLIGALGFLFRSIAKIHYNTQWKVILTMVAGTIAIGAAIVLLAKQLPNEGYLGKIISVAGVMVGTIASLVGIMALIAHFSKDTTFSLTKKSAETMNKAFEGLGLLIAGILVIAVSLKMLESSSIGDIAAKAGIILGILTLLTGLVVGIQIFQKKFQGAIDATILRQLFALTAIFGAIALVVGLLNNFGGDAIEMLKKVGVVSLVIIELSVIAGALAALAKAGVSTKAATIALLGLSAVFAVIGLTLAAMLKLGASGSKIIGASQVVMLVILELSLIAAAIGALGYSGITEMMLLAIPTLLAMSACFAIIGLTLAAMVSLGATGSKVIGASQVIVLVLLELTVIGGLLGLLAPLEALSIVGSLGILALTGVMYVLSKFLVSLGSMDIADGLVKIENIKTLLWSLIGMLAVLSLLGVGGVVGATSLVILAAGLTLLAVALDKMQDIDFRKLSNGIQDMGVALAILVGLGLVGSLAGAGLIVFAAGITAFGLACIAASVGVTMFMAVIGKIGEKVSEAVSGVVDGAKKMADGFKEKFGKILDFVSEVISTLKAKITGVDFKGAGKAMGDGLVAGFRAGTGWHSPPKFIVDFFRDCGVAVNDNANGLTDLFEGTGESWASALSKALNLNLDGILNGINLGSLDLSNPIASINSLMNMLDYSKSKTQQQQKALVELYSKGQMSATDFDREMKKLNQTTEKSTNMFEDMKDATLDLGSAMGGAGSKVQSFQESLKSTLESQMNIFQKFEQKTAMSKDELLANMRSQIEGMTNWAAQMQQLATMGIDKGLYQKLAEMGPQGAEYVGAFASMTAEEMAAANEMWAQSLVLPGQISHQLNASWSGISGDMVNGLSKGWTDKEGVFRENILATSQLAQEEFKSDNGIASPSKVYYEMGHNMMLGLRNGIAACGIFPRQVLQQVSDICLNTAKAGFSEGKYYTIGYNVGQGIYNGLKAGAGPIYSLMADIGAKAEEVLRKVTEVRSPSRVFQEIGMYWDLGLAKGIDENANTVYSAIDDMGYQAIEVMKYTVAQIASELTNTIEDPVITPVLDLSRVQAGIRTLNSSFNNNRMMMNADRVMNLQNAQQTPANISFTQNNYSPKSLSRMDIYRDTKNMFAQARAKGALGS